MPRAPALERWSITSQGYCECLPRHENHISLDPERKDSWGVPIANIHWSWSDNEKALREDMKTQCAEMLEAAGCKNVHPYDDNAPMAFVELVDRPEPVETEAKAEE